MVGFLVLAVTLAMDWWAFPYEISEVAPADSSAAGISTVRTSAAELVRLDGDTSMLACYSCHEADDPPELQLDADGRILMEEHSFDFELRHGASHRNENCFQCHEQSNLEMLRKVDGTLIPITEGNVLCGGCHGTTYRDWESGLHGRVSGYWNADLGPQRKEDCTACHNAHSPAFPSLKPWRAPQPFRPQRSEAGDSTEVHEDA